MPYSFITKVQPNPKVQQRVYKELEADLNTSHMTKPTHHTHFTREDPTATQAARMPLLRSMDTLRYCTKSPAATQTCGASDPRSAAFDELSPVHHQVQQSWINRAPNLYPLSHSNSIYSTQQYLLRRRLGESSLKTNPFPPCFSLCSQALVLPTPTFLQSCG